MTLPFAKSIVNNPDRHDIERKRLPSTFNRFG